MQILLFPFVLLSGLGLALSIIAHLMALAGLELPGGRLVWLLHAGIFVVWIPTVLVSIRTTRYAYRKDFWKTALAGCPVWMKRTLYALFAYALVNFVLFATQNGGGSGPGGTNAPSVVRLFSGHWMVFYGAAFAVLYSVIHAPRLLKRRKCPNGHNVAPTAEFCPDCGRSLQKDAENV